MTPELKAKWIEALRSGKYEQGKGFLNFQGRFCCLGVLADIIEPNLWESHLEYPALFWGKSSKSNGLLEDDIVSNTNQSVLTQMNDRGDSFEKIADYIEKEL